MRPRDRDETGLFVRIPRSQARRLDRASAAVAVPKKDLIAGLLARHVDPDSPDGIEQLRHTAEAGGATRGEFGPQTEAQRGFGYFTPAPQDDVLDEQEAAALLKVEVETLIRLAEQGELPGRKLDAHWRFARHALMQWLSQAD